MPDEPTARTTGRAASQLTGPIYHLAEPADWAARNDEYRCPSIESEGFIHCSTAIQLSRVAQDHFAGRIDLVLLTIDPESLGDMVVYEDLYQLGEVFPHIYGPLPIDAVISASSYRADGEEGWSI